MESIDDMRNLREFKTCHHNELPMNFPISDQGFEHQYTFLMSNAAKKAIGLIIEEPSLVRIVLNPHNPKNKVMAQLVHSDVEEKGTPIGVTSATHNSMMVTIDPSRKPYIVRIVQSDLDTSDPCPVFDFHISVKPLQYVVWENLMCHGYQLPPT